MGNSESTEKDKTFWAVAGISAASEETKYNGRHEEIVERRKVAVDQVDSLEPAEIVEVVFGEDGSTKDILRKPGGSGVGPFGSLQPFIALAVPSENLDAAAQKGHTSKEYVKAVKDISSSSKHPLLQFYTTQSLQSLGDERARVSVPIWISGYKNSSRDSKFLNVASSWFEHIEKAIEQINFAVPGLNLHIELNLAKAKVRIAGSNSTKCYTDNNILTDSTSEIYLYSEAKEKKRTSCHELFHALGVGHEHQRRDRDNYVEVESGDNNKSYKKRDDLYGITQFDPFSIMLYPEDEKMLRKYGDSVWFTKSSSEPNREMSQLDKVGLNNLYRPCKHKYYSPKIGRTDLYYCGRHVGKCADRPNHDGYCGPDNGPNCPACRVLKTNRMTELWKQKKPKWQGWTGKVYCGDFFRVVMESHNGNCGPNNGPSCPTCYKELSNCH